MQVGHHAERHGEYAEQNRILPIPIRATQLIAVVQRLDELGGRVLALRCIGAQEIDHGLLALVTHPHRPKGEGKADQREDQPPELKPVVVHDSSSTVYLLPSTVYLPLGARLDAARGSNILASIRTSNFVFHVRCGSDPERTRR